MDKEEVLARQARVTALLAEQFSTAATISVEAWFEHR
jgi:hypothetical protein